MTSIETSNDAILKRFRMGQDTKAISVATHLHEAVVYQRLHLAQTAERIEQQEEAARAKEPPPSSGDPLLDALRAVAVAHLPAKG